MKKPQNEKGVIKKGTSKSIMRVRTSCRRQTYRKKRVREEKGKLWGVAVARSERFPLLLLQLLLLARGAKPIEVAEYMDGQRWKGYAKLDDSVVARGAYSVSHTRLA